MTGHPLDRPVWSSLATRHAAFALGGDRARRFAPDLGPLAGTRDDATGSLAELAALVPPDASLLLLQADPIVLADDVSATTTADGVQLIAGDPARLAAVRDDPRVEELTADDVPAMVELAAQTRPGPFARRTPALGQFWGIKHAGTLLAMAGERLKQDGFTEVSGVCTRPEARGQGLARVLSAFVAARIVERGETPYLHAYASNTPALRLYESLGFRLRAQVHVATVARRA